MNILYFSDRRLRSIRKSQGTQTTELADKIGMNAKYISQLETGAGQPLSTF